MDLLDGFGINLKLLLAQIVNFVVLLLILWKFAYKPILKMLDKRKETIEDSLKKAEDIEKEKVEIEIKKEEILKKAQEEAVKILQEVRADSVKLKAELEEKTKAEIDKMMKKAKTALEKDRETMLQEVKKEAVALSVLIASQIVKRNLSDAVDEEMIDSAIKEMRPQ